MDAKIHAKIWLFLQGVHFGESSELNGRVVARQDRAMYDVFHVTLSLITPT